MAVARGRSAAERGIRVHKTVARAVDTRHWPRTKRRMHCTIVGHHGGGFATHGTGALIQTRSEAGGYKRTALRREIRKPAGRMARYLLRRLTVL